MFEHVEPLPPDPILGLSEAYASDPNPRKINLGVGVYKDANGRTPILECVRWAAARVLQQTEPGEYLPIEGLDSYRTCVRELIFGPDHPLLAAGRVATAQAPGGTGALRVAAEFIARTQPEATVHLSEPTWPNHHNLFAAAGVPVASYPYFDAERGTLDFQRRYDALADVPAGDVVVFHACCHNPTGADPSAGQWQQLAQLAAERGFLPLFDFAYQGFGEGIDADAVGIRAFAQTVGEMLVANSFSKNFSLYRQRIGALTLVAADADVARAAMTHVKAAIRGNYSNPPAFGAELVATVLTDADLRRLWEKEVGQMRQRIQSMRQLFVQTLKAKGVTRDFSFIARQRGMFSFSGLSRQHVQALREKHSIYIVDSGRISVAGMTAANIDDLCSAVADVIG